MAGLRFAGWANRVDKGVSSPPKPPPMRADAPAIRSPQGWSILSSSALALEAVPKLQH